MKEFRCKQCRRLLLKYDGPFGQKRLVRSGVESMEKNAATLDIEIKCGKCKTLNYLTQEEAVRLT